MMPNYFDLKCSYLGDGFVNLPRVHLTYEGFDDDGECSVIEEDEDISEEGYRVLLGAAESGDIDYTINDACDKFFDEIDIITADINEIDSEWQDLSYRMMADPMYCSEEAFNKEIQGLRWRRMIKEEIKSALERDLSKLLGRYEVPF